MQRQIKAPRETIVFREVDDAGGVRYGTIQIGGVEMYNMYTLAAARSLARKLRGHLILKDQLHEQA